MDRGVSHPDCADNEAAVQAIPGSAPGRFHCLDQFGNPANPAAHEQGTGAELPARLSGRGHGRDTRVTLVSGLGTGAPARGVVVSFLYCRGEDCE